MLIVKPLGRADNKTCGTDFPQETGLGLSFFVNPNAPYGLH